MLRAAAFEANCTTQSAFRTGTALFGQTPGSVQEQQLFLGIDAQISEIDFSFGDEALACTVAGPRGTSAVGSLADDGKGVRTVTEGDVVDCTPRWAPGGRGEILYASAGVGRTKSGEWGGLSPFALHRLRFADNSVEVLTADAKYDYLSPLMVMCMINVRCLDGVELESLNITEVDGRSR